MTFVLCVVSLCWMQRLHVRARAEDRDVNRKGQESCAP